MVWRVVSQAIGLVGARAIGSWKPQWRAYSGSCALGWWRRRAR